MKKMIYLLVTVLLVSIAAAGCGIKDVNLPGTAPNTNQGITTNKIAFTIMKEDAVPNDIKELAEKNQEKRGYKAFEQKDGEVIVLIALGERNTGGYEINVKSVEDIEGKTSILVEEVKPSGDMVTQVITYPRVFVEMTGIAPNFIVKDTEGKAFDELN